MNVRLITRVVLLLQVVPASALAQTSGDFMPYAQASESVVELQRAVSIRMPDVTVEEALGALARAGGLGLSYDRGLAALRQRMDLDVRAEPVGRAMQRVLRGTGLEFWASWRGDVLVRVARPDTGASLVGRILDETRNPLAGAQVELEPTAGPPAQRTLSDEQGAFRFSAVPAGRYTLRVTQIGYRTDAREVVLAADETLQLDIELEVAPIALERVDVDAERDVRRERATFDNEAGVTARVVGGRELKVLPGLAEADVMRAVELLPGVVSTSDFSSAFNVRGGAADQNLVLLDGFPLFNPFHFGGMFSVFNADVIERAELQAGGFGAEYGGRVSSVLNVETRSDADEGRQIDVGVSLLASRFAMRSPLPENIAQSFGGDHGSWYISARRSYVDLFIPSNSTIPAYHLTDLQGGATIGTAGGGTLSVVGYLGRDVVDRSGVTTDKVEEDNEEALRFKWSWGNGMAGIRWTQPLGRAWTVDARIGRSEYSEDLGFSDFDDTRLSTDIAHDMAALNVSRVFARALTVQTGVELSRFDVHGLNLISDTELWRVDERATYGALYASARLRPTEDWIIEPGLRLDTWRASDSTRYTVSPRFAVKRFFGAQRDAAVKLSVGRYAQFLQSLRDDDIPFGNDIWLAADRHVPTLVSDQIQVGFERFWGVTWQLSAEAYARRFRGVIDSNPISDLNDPADEYLVGTGRSYGLDVLVRREQGPLRGWIALSLLNAEQTFPDPLAQAWADVPPTVTYPPVFDRTVDLDIVLEFSLPSRIEAGVRWNYGSSIPYTRPQGQYVEWQFDPSTGGYRVPEGDEDDWSYYAIMEDRNAERYPAYHRLDFTLRRTYHPRWGVVTPYLQVLNVYNRKNVMAYEFNYEDAPPTRGGITQFPLLPTIGVEVSF